MKKFLSVLLVISMLFVLIAVPAYAEDEGIEISTEVENFEDGSYLVTKTVQTSNPNARTTVSGTKTATYYTASGVAVWDAVLYGEFSYTYGVTSRAIAANVNVHLYSSLASLVSKNAYTSGMGAYGQVRIRYYDVETYRQIVLTCDVYGNIS